MYLEMAESTQYGLKNYLKVFNLDTLEQNIYKLDLEHKSGNKLHLFISFLSADLVRFHYSFSEKFNLIEPNEYLDFKAFNFTKENFIRDFEETDLEINFFTELLRVVIYKKTLQIKIFDHEGDLISSDEPELGFWSAQLNNWDSEAKQEIRAYKQFSSLSHPPMIYGLGDKTGDLNRFGRRFRNQPIDALGFDAKFTDPLYKDIPFFIVLDPTTKKSHGTFFDNFYPKFFDMGLERKPSPYYYFGAEGGDLNYYFIYGPDIKKVTSRYLELTGKPPEWPDYSYGYLGSGMAYTESVGDTRHCEEQSEEAIHTTTELSLLNTFKRMQEKKISMSAFHLSSGYILNAENKRHQFIWNNEKFANPQEFSKQAKDLGVELCANVKPVLLCSHPWYGEASELGLFLKNAQGQDLVVDYWGGQGSYINFLNPVTKLWWKDKLKTNILGNGISGIWNDNNEYEIFEKHNAEGLLGKQILEMSKLAYEASIESGIQEPWILSRSGYSGIQKYAQTWTGDNYSSWQALQYDIPLLSNLGLSGIIHCGSDIGGFWGPEPDPELLLRWIQYGIFTPRFCIHSYKPTPTEADMFEKSHQKFFKTIQEFFKLREELIPYIKDAANQAASNGIPIMRPLVYDFQHDSNTYERNFEYMFGDKYLVAPIYEANAKSREVYLPEIVDAKNQWINYFSGKKYSGGQLIEIKANFDEIPVFEYLTSK